MGSLQRYRDILCVDKNASKEQIKKSYKKEAMRWHPDKNNGDDIRFKKITEAYEKLTDTPQITPNPNPNPIFRQFQSTPFRQPSRPPNTRSFFTEDISQEEGTMSQEFVNISNGVKIIHKVMSNLKTGDRTEFTFKTFI